MNGPAGLLLDLARRIRYRVGLRLLRPYLLNRFIKADELMEVEGNHADRRRGGYRQGVWSTLNAVLRLHDLPGG